MTHMYFSARAEGRISYGHLGRTDSCYYYYTLKKYTVLRIVKLAEGQRIAGVSLCLLAG